MILYKIIQLFVECFSTLNYDSIPSFFWDIINIFYINNNIDSDIISSLVERPEEQRRMIANDLKKYRKELGIEIKEENILKIGIEKINENKVTILIGTIVLLVIIIIKKNI